MLSQFMSTRIVFCHEEAVSRGVLQAMTVEPWSLLGIHIGALPESGSAHTGLAL